MGPKYEMVLARSLFAEKAEVFLEVFGNGEIRSHTEERLRRAASQLTVSVAESLETATHPALNTALLKVQTSAKLSLSIVLLFTSWSVFLCGIRR